MNNHWTRAMRECCEHTKPVTVPCQDCIDKLADKIVAIGKTEAAYEAKNSVTNVKVEITNIEKQLLASETERKKLDKKIAEQEKFIGFLKSNLKTLKEQRDEYAVMAHADAVVKSIRVNP